MVGAELAWTETVGHLDWKSVRSSSASRWYSEADVLGQHTYVKFKSPYLLLNRKTHQAFSCDISVASNLFSIGSPLFGTLLKLRSLAPACSRQRENILTLHQCRWLSVPVLL
jgi:hypothetical protein